MAPLRIRQLRARRLRHYQRSLALLEERLPDSPLVRGLRDELAVLGGDQPKLVPPTRQNGINKLVPPTPQDGSNLVSRTAGRRAAGSLARCPG